MKLKNWILGGIAAIGLSVFALGNANAALTIDMPGAYRFGPATNHDGYVILGGEVTTTGGADRFGTATTLALTGTETTYLEATVLGMGSTQTQVVGQYVCTGTFYRIGTDAIIRLGSETAFIESTNAPGLDAFFQISGDSIHLKVVGSDTSDTEFGATVKYITLDAN